MDAHEAVPVGGVGIGHIRTGNAAGILAVAGGIALRDVRAVAGDGQILALKLVPDLLVNPRGRGEQIVLELEGSVAGREIQVCQFRLRQKAQRQIRGIDQQGRHTEAVHLVKIGAGLVLPVPLDHILDAQKQVRHRRAFLEAVAVIGVLRTVAQRPHEFRDPDIGGAGEGGNAVVAVEGAVVQGLGMGGLRPEEQVVVLPLVHVADDGGSVGGSLWIIGHTRTREIQSKAHQRGDQLHAHDGQRQNPGSGALAIPFGAGAHLLTLRNSLRHLQLTVEHDGEIQHQKYQVIYKVEGNLQRQAAQLQRHRLEQRIGAGQHPSRQHPRDHDLHRAEPPAHQPGAVGHVQHHKAVQEAEAVGDHIGKVEAVPDEVQLPDDEADVEKQQQPHGAAFVPAPDVLRHQVQEHQQNAENAAVHIGQAFLEGRLDAAAHVPRHLPHGVQKPLEGILLGDVQPEAGGEIVHAGLGGLQGRQRREGQNGGHSQRQHRKQGNPPKIRCQLLPSAPAADFIHKKQQENENTGKEPDIIIGVDGQKQRHRVEETLFLLQQAHRPQRHQGQQGEGVQPHHVPLIPQRPGAQPVKAPEYRNGRIVLAEQLFQKNGKEHPRESQLHRYQQGKEFQQPHLRHQNAEQIQRRRQIVGDQPQIIHPHADAPGVQQPAPAADRAAERHEEGIILVVHIGIQHGILAERLVFADKHDKQHSHAGNGKGQRRIIPPEFFAGSLHRDSPLTVES